MKPSLADFADATPGFKCPAAAVPSMRALTGQTAVVALPLLALVLAGCGSPDAAPEPTPVAPIVAARQTHDLTVRVSQQTADGPAMTGVEVQAFVLDAAGTPGPALPRSTDTQGFARFTFEEPVRIAVRATAPGWTREGVVLQVGDRIAFDQVPEAPGFHTATLSERDLFLPLLRSELRLAAQTSLMTSTVVPGSDGSVQAPLTAVDLVLPEGLAPAYLARIAAADVRVRWEDTASARAHLSAALAWDGVLWVRGEAPGPGLLPGPREASFSGALPAEGRPDDLAAARLQAAAVLESAAVGDVPLSFEVRLRLVGLEPPGLPAACHAMAACPQLPELPPVAG
jgi:hypothetical protein